MVLACVALCGGLTALCAYAGVSGNTTVGEIGLDLLLVPVAAASFFFGLRGALIVGAVAASVSALLYVLADLFSANALASNLVLVGLVGTIVGVSADKERVAARFLRRRYAHSPELLAATKDGRLLKLNPEWERHLGYTEQDLLGRDFLDLVHPEDRERVSASRERLAHGGQVEAGPARMRCADGRYLWIEWSARHDEADGLNYIAGRDITERRKVEETLALHQEMLERAVAERTAQLQARTVELDRSLRELELTRREELRHLAMVAEFRDDKTALHTERVGITSALIARELGFLDEDCQLLHDAAPLHDIGKIGTPDAILLNSGELSDAERSVMRQHTYLGYRLLNESHSPVLKVGAIIALHHHEWWDGTGYPAGLAGEEIPLEARIVALADVFDALTHDRAYKPAWPLGDALREIRTLAGRQFDPTVVAAFEHLDPKELLALIEQTGKAAVFTG